MADDTAERPLERNLPDTGPAPVSWPLVERRRSHQTPPQGVERRARNRQDSEPFSQPPALSAAPLWPFRLGALAAASIRALEDIRDDWSVGAATAVMVVFTVWACLRPVEYRDTTRVRLQIVAELALVTVITLVTGAWASPFAVCLIPTCMLAGFAAGGWFSGQLAIAAVAAITVQHVPEVGASTGLRDGALWGGLLALVAFTSGLAHRAAVEAAEQQQLALDRVSRLSEANSLLFSLQRVAQTLPASLDLDEVLSSTIARVRSMVKHDAIIVYLLDGGRFVPVRAIGCDARPALTYQQLPSALRAAVESPKTVRREWITFVEGTAPDAVTPGARCGLYGALRARGALVGLVAVERTTDEPFDQQDAEVVHGLCEPFGIAIDNARMFSQLRMLGADEERTRIARELHDHIGSSLATINFELDMVSLAASRGEDVAEPLKELRTRVGEMVTEVRDALYDLRTEVTDSRDLVSVLREYATRVGERADVRVELETSQTGRVSLQEERELWQIAREAIRNVEQHADAATIRVFCHETSSQVLISVVDDGIGIASSATHPHRESYGIVGMRERAARLGATLDFHTPAFGGTEVRIVLRTTPRGER